MRTRLSQFLHFLVAPALLLAAPVGAKTPVRPRAGATAGKAGQAALTPVQSLEGIREYHLTNGLRVLLFPDQSQPTVTVNITYLVGSRHEGYGETGMAHLLEHLLFKGTKTRDNILGQLQTRGAFSNGSTWFDRTNYFETLPAIPGNLEFALALEADRMINSRVSKTDLDTEFSVVRNEFELGENNPEAILQERVYSTAYLWHNYGKSTIGSRTDIERVPIDNLQAFYRRFYQPDNAILIVAGKFDETEALGLIQKHFAGLVRPARKLDATYTQEPVQDGERTVILRRSGDVGLVGLGYHGLAGSDPLHVAEEALVHLLTEKPTGRLYKSMVETGLAAEVSGSAQPFADPGMIEFYAKVRTDQSLDKVREMLIAGVESVAKGGITDAELERFRASALKQIELQLTNSGRIGVELSEWAGMGDWRLLFYHRDRVKQLTRKEVEDVAARFLKSSNRTLGMFIPTKNPDRSPLAQTPDVQALLKDYKGAAATREGEAFVASIDNIEQRTERLSLPSGMQVALLSKATRGGAVQAALTVHYGNEKTLMGKRAAALMLPQLLLRGSKKHSYSELKDELDRLKAELRVADFGGAGQAQFTVTTVRENLVPVLALLTEILSQPAFLPAELEIARKELLTRLEEQLQDPSAQAFRTIQRRMQPYPASDVRYIPTTQEQLDEIRAVKLADVQTLYRDLLGGSAAQLAIVGDFDGAAVKAELGAHLGQWRSPSPWQRIERPFIAGVRGAEETLVTPDKQMAMVVAGQAIAVRDDDPDYAALELGNFILGGAFKSRLVDRLRQKEGISYGAFSNVDGNPFDRNAVFFAGAICAPQNAAKAMTAMLEEVERLLRDGIAKDELEESKKSYQLRFDNLLARDNALARLLALTLYEQRTMTYYSELQTRINKLQSQGVLSVLKRLLEPERLVRVKAGDLASR